MNELTNFFSQHLAEVYLAYGFACLILTLATVRQHTGYNPLQTHLWLLGLFGLGHGLNEFFFWSWRTHFSLEIPWLDPFASSFLTLAYFAFFSFGRRILRHHFPDTSRWSFWLGRRLWLLPFFFLGLAVAFSPDKWSALRTASRLVLGVPGAWMTATGFLIFLYKDRHREGHVRYKLITFTAGLSFFCYGLLACYTRDYDLPWLTILPEVEQVNQYFGFPVQLARAGVFLVGILCITLLLRFWNYQVRNRELAASTALAARTFELASFNSTLEARIRERTETLLLTNDELEREIAKHRQTENELVASAARLRALFDQDAMGVTFLDNSGHYLKVNQRFCTLVGRDKADLVGHHFDEISHNDGQATFHALWAEVLAGSRKSFSRDKSYVLPDGGLIWINVHIIVARNYAGEISHFIGLYEDISERRHAEQKLRDQDERQRRSQRLESIGSLAGGIAHDLNNALVPLLAGVSLIRDYVPEEDADLLTTMESSAQRAAAMVKQLLVFARGAEGRKLNVSLVELVEEMDRFIQRTFPKNIQFVPLCACPQATVIGDPTQLHQVLLNLCVNARDAMPSGGTIGMELSRVEVSEFMALSHLGAQSGPHILCSVSDTGTGIPPAIIDRIFDPFFSTKGPDKGTGLGLSTVLGIIRGHGGFVDVQTQEGKGSRFLVYLPESKAQDSAAGREAELALPDGRGRRLLVVDDESSVRNVIQRLLRGAGYECQFAKNGIEALAWLSDEQRPFDLIILDVTMPTMDGIELLRVMQDRHPAITRIVMSGNLSKAQLETLRGLNVKAILAKPFTPQELVKALVS